ncbi:type II toxin-antitoxin system PemK/MazF family toxin [Microbacterium nymphoidis]|uniref:type II toxin-antitoxin system PemK/MazF family toxin n=1 Tax=Microbacterium nymphoidis TaxID=2898586 RepID=UPI001E2E26DB|nr:type II toxin-antitoxin system PemK/MazF family toxin [Microbacterium nymphoidis]MCD2497480.1 type II toxin-antitoxin system PemK/MazF family toxin [Microbacterium nymphoidis]
MSSGRGFLVEVANVVGQVLRALLLNRGGGSVTKSERSSRPSSAESPQPATKRPTIRTQPSTSARTRSGTAATRPATTSQRPTEKAAPPSDETLSSARRAELAARERLLEGEPSPGQLGASATFEVSHRSVGAITVSYSPEKDGAPDAGEVVWTWIPYEEADGRGKDRPVLIIGRRDAEHVYAVRLTSKSHDGERDFISIGSGDWDGQGRESWVDVDQLYEVHERGLRREAAVLDRRRFGDVAAVLRERYGWRVSV